MSYAGGDVRTAFESDATVNLKKSAVAVGIFPKYWGSDYTEY